MKTSTKLFFFAIVIGLIAIGGWKIVKPILQDRADKQTSDAVATKGKIAIRIDSWAGYFPVRSMRLKKDMRGQGYIVDVVDDNADMDKRMELLANGDIQFAVATVDSYLATAAKYKFPGRIIAVIDESKGGDAMVSWKDKVPNLESLKKTPDQRFSPDHANTWKIAYTPNSPSHHLVKAAVSHFGIPSIKDFDASRKIETNGSSEALKLFLGRKVDVAVLWEPDVSKAIEAGAIKLLSTENTSRLIVDILLVNTDYAQKNPEMVALFLKSYFRTLKHYAGHPDDLKKEMKDELKLDTSIVEKMIGGVAWVNLSDNAQEWFGVKTPSRQAEQGLVDTIESTVEILNDSGDISGNPLPDHDPYRITQKGFVEDLYRRGLQTGFKSMEEGPAALAVAQGIDRPFAALSVAQWSSLRAIGTLKIEPIRFQSGTSDLLLEGKEDLDKIVTRLKHYPTFRIIVKGHTSTKGDSEANAALSLERAEAVARYLQVTYNVDPNRVRAVGLGGTEPLPKEPDESSRAYDYRLPRVELSLLSEVY